MRGVEMTEEKLIGTLTCPECGNKEEKEIPTSSCLQFYSCKKCGKTIKAEKSCCVFCDYSDKKCPGAQKEV